MPLWVPVRNTMPQLMASTTNVRMAVASVELTPSMPILARMEVRAANTADPSANTNHIRIPPKAKRSALFLDTPSVLLPGADCKRFPLCRDGKRARTLPSGPFCLEE